MAYSIYYYLKPAALAELDSKPDSFSILSSFFEPDFRRNPIENGFLFGWIKPHGDKAKEVQLFRELELLRSSDLLVEIAADDWQSEASLCKKLVSANFDLLIPYECAHRNR